MSEPAAPAATTTPAPEASAGDQPAGPAEQPAGATDVPAGGGDGGERAGGAPAGDARSEEAASETADLGGESKSGTGQPGGESARNEFRQAARNVFGGDRVGGNKFVFYLSNGEQGPPPHRLLSALENYARYAFAEPDGWDTCRLEFRGRHTVLLRGAPGQGRATMAIRLLQTAQSHTVYELNPEIDLARMPDQLTAHPLQSGTAFLLHEPQNVAQLTAYTLRSLEDLLAAADSRLVVTVGTDVAFPDPDLLRYEMHLPAAPALREILDRHLDYLIGEERAWQLLDDPEVAKLVENELLGDDVPCGHAARLASLLSQSSDPIDVDAIARHLRQRSSDEFQLWFDNLKPAKLRYFAVALAVLDGLPYEDVADAARRMSGRFSSGGPIVLGEGSVLKVASSDPFQVDQADLLRKLQATTTVTTIPTPYGPAPATAICYRNGDYPRQVLERAWSCYQIEEKLLDWLDELVTVPSVQVRTYAGTALGVVASLAFEYVRQRLLVPWAHDHHLWKNEAAANALRMAAEIPQLQSGVRWLVESWYGSGNADAQCTAALSLGTRLGRQEATRSIQALERLAMVEDPSVRVGIARGFASLLADDPALVPEMYRVVGRSVADPNRTFTGQYVFLFIAEDLYLDVTSGDGRSVRWPALLHLAQEREELRGPLVQCWAWVLTEGPALKLAQRVLRVWAGRAEADPGAREAFTRMARAIAVLDARAGAVLARCAKQWSSDEELQPLPAVALAVEGVIPC